MMWQVIYVSTAVSSLSAATVDEILETSRRNNAAAGVTGLLLYDGYRFLHGLEGPEEAVRATYQRVRADPRHRALVQLSIRPVEARAFGEAALAARRVRVAAGATMAELVDMLTDEVDTPTQALFRDVARVRVAA